MSRRKQFLHMAVFPAGLLLALMLSDVARASSIFLGNDLIYASVAIPGTASGVIGDGHITGADPSMFSNNFLVMSSDNTLLSSAPTAFSSVPYVTIGSTQYFEFLYDLQETQKEPHINILDISISVNSGVIWASTATIELNAPGITATLTPLGNGTDMRLLVPVSLFNGKGLTGSSTFVFSSMQSDGHDGNDEWGFRDDGTTFDPDDPIGAAVPEPASALLLFTGIGLVALSSHWRRRPK